MGTLLSVKDLTVKFETFERSVTALESVSLRIEEKELLGIVGSAGAGKTVLLKSIINLVPFPGRIAKGEVWFEGENLLVKRDEEIRRIRGREISLILPNPRSQLDPLMKVGDQLANLVSAHRNAERRIARQEALNMLRKVGINDPERRMQAYPHELSSGMAQRIVIGMALMNSPRVVLADEPTSGLDVTVQRQILDLLAALVRDFGSSAVIVTRDLGVVASYCQRVAVMYQGQIVEIDSVKMFFKRAIHPVSTYLLGSTFAAKGRREKDGGSRVRMPEVPSGDEQLRELEPGHFVRLSMEEAEKCQAS